MARALDVLTAPGRFFADADETPQARYPIFIVLAISLIGSVSFGYLMVTILRNSDAGVGLAVFVTVVAFVIQLVGNLLIWVVYGGLFFAISSFMDGEGGFRETFVFTGWGFLPRVVGAVVSGVVSIVGVSGVDPPTIDFEQPAQAQQEIQRFATEASASDLSAISSAVGLVVLLWSAYIWMHAVETEQDLDRNQALIAVGIPVGLALLWRLNGLLSTL